jgi:hypothetical protein
MPSPGASTPVAIAAREHQQRADERVDDELDDRRDPVLAVPQPPVRKKNGTSMRSKKTTNSARSCAMQRAEHRGLAEPEPEEEQPRARVVSRPAQIVVATHSTAVSAMRKRLSPSTPSL